jgi:hypothetical protein
MKYSLPPTSKRYWLPTKRPPAHFHEEWRTTEARSRRQAVNVEEYNPSRRSNAPIWPEPLACSASDTMRCLYSAVKRRRLAWAMTSGSGWVFGSGPAEAREPYGCSCGRKSFSPCSVIKVRGVSHSCWHGGCASEARVEVRLIEQRLLVGFVLWWIRTFLVQPNSFVRSKVESALGRVLAPFQNHQILGPANFSRQWCEFFVLGEILNYRTSPGLAPLPLIDSRPMSQ